MHLIKNYFFYKQIRRVSFANPIYQEGLADDIDRRSPVIRAHSSPSSRSLKILSSIQAKVSSYVCSVCRKFSVFLYVSHINVAVVCVHGHLQTVDK